MNPQLQDPNSIINALTTLSQNLATNIPQVTLPTLNVQLPSMNDLSSKYNEFLSRASNDPDIVNYYNQLLQQAQGDTQIAQQYLEQDYQTGTRNILDNLSGTLAQLGLTFTGEQQGLQNTLNQRGIGLTQDPSGKLTYAGGGEAGYELGQLNQSQQLRQEAEQRSAQQGVTSLSQNLQKQLTSQGQNLVQTAQNLQQQKQQQIAQRAGTYYGLYQNQQAANAYNQQQQQFNQATGLGGAGTQQPITGDTSARQAGYKDYSAYQQAIAGHPGNWLLGT